jgi:K+ transporter
MLVPTVVAYDCITTQAMMLGVLPRLEVTHTDKDMEGQIYIKQVNQQMSAGDCTSR